MRAHPGTRAALSAVRAGQYRRRPIRLGDGIRVPRHNRSGLRRCGGGGFATLSRRPHTASLPKGFVPLGQHTRHQEHQGKAGRRAEMSVAWFGPSGIALSVQFIFAIRWCARWAPQFADMRSSSIHRFEPLTDPPSVHDSKGHFVLRNKGRHHLRHQDHARLTDSETGTGPHRETDRSALRPAFPWCLCAWW